MGNGGGPNLLLLKSMLAGGNLYFREYAKCGLLWYGLLKLSNGFRLFIVYMALVAYRIKRAMGIIH